MRPGSKLESERDLFEFDRSVLITELDAILLTVRNAVTELAMLAAENVFDKRLSANLKRKARDLDRMARRLDDLGKVLARDEIPQCKKVAGCPGNLMHGLRFASCLIDRAPCRNTAAEAFLEPARKRAQVGEAEHLGDGA